ncbi:MAG: triphosphoribosyl-dephospho-CoA synthase [Methylocystis sp.]|nr:triphosphoribosyl-dephospho-CoA synthase [Methylocystis sp.]MBI3275819.1 triphosphoribosyl-dephospho-CoA synthase [Methylocystis sp.]
MAISPEHVARAFIAACQDELESLKPGNVHVFAPGHGMEAGQFMASAQAAAGPLTRQTASVGERIFGAVEATFARVGCNTNLGIVLLCAPLAHAALQAGGADLRQRVAAVLDELDRGDADLAFRAILRASPAGLGAAPQHDVARPALVGLREAMAQAACRDRVAYQYASDFEDIFATGIGALASARAANCPKPTATLHVFMSFLSKFPDSHIVRKFGQATGDLVMAEAREFLARLEAADDPQIGFELALQWDRSLKARRLNPGTSADLTVATLFADYCSRILLSGGEHG